MLSDLTTPSVEGEVMVYYFYYILFKIERELASRADSIDMVWACGKNG